MKANSIDFGDSSDDLELSDGSRIAVIGGGPAGSFVSYFLLEMADRSGLEIDVEIFSRNRVSSRT